MFFRARPLHLLWLLALATLFSLSTRAQEITPLQIVQGFPVTAAGINSQDAYFGSNAGTIQVMTPGSYCDTTVLLSNGHTLQFSPGTYYVNIAGADSNSGNVTWAVKGAGSNQTTLKSCPSSNKDVITSQNFGSFTGGSNFYGVYHPIIQGLTIDGNKASETAGFGIRLYGRAVAPNDVLVQNAYQDGWWLEWGGTESDTGSGTQVNGNSTVIESDYNGGNGFTFKGVTGALNQIPVLIAHNNGGWGFQTGTNIIVGQINVYSNTSGGCDVQANGGLTASNADCDTSTGWGLLEEASGGAINIGGGIIGGGIPLELRSTAGGTIVGSISNPAAATTCIKINGGGNFVIAVGFIGCSTSLVTFTSEASQDSISGISNVATTLLSGSPAQGDFINISAPSANYYFQVPTATIHAGGWAPVMPTTNGTLLGAGNTDIHFQSFTSSTTCSTAGSVGATCTTASISLPTAEADTNYRVAVTGIGPTNVPVIQTVTKSNSSLTITIAALTAAAATFASYDITVTHQ